MQESLSTLRMLRQRLPSGQPRSFFSMTGGVLGFGLAAAIGVALAERDIGTDRKVIAIVGDGSVHYGVQALWTAAQHGLPILFVVPHNGAYNILKSFAGQLHTPGVPGLDLPGIDYVALATGYGTSAERVTDPDELPGALRRGMEVRKPHLIEVKVDAAVPSLL